MLNLCLTSIISIVLVWSDQCSKQAEAPGAGLSKRQVSLSREKEASYSARHPSSPYEQRTLSRIPLPVDQRLPAHS
jgi:hypothetical protein